MRKRDIFYVGLTVLVVLVLWTYGLPFLQATGRFFSAGWSAATGTTTEKVAAPAPTAVPHAEVVKVGAAVVVGPFGNWPHQNGANKTELITAPAGEYVLVQYGYESRTPKEAAACGIALVAPGTSTTLTVWDGNAETLTASAEAVTAYAVGELAARKGSEPRCQVWTVYGLPDQP